MSMITKPRSEGGDEELSWGTEGGFIRKIYRAGSRCTYVIEEPLGWKMVRHNKKRYTVFCPWIYFIPHLRWRHSVDDCMLYVFFSKRRLEVIEQSMDLLLPPFPNTSPSGAVCLPSQLPIGGSPIEAALYIIKMFWVSRGSELIRDVIPDELRKGMGEIPNGRALLNWSRLSPKEVMKIKFRPLNSVLYRL